MKAVELRIGNWVYISDNYTHAFYKQETQINIHNMMYLCGETKEPLDFTFEPIPLTEEILLKCGFESYKFDHKESQYRFKDRLIVIRDNEFCDYGTSVELKYLHQLQNLYFVLTNEELQIEL